MKQRGKSACREQKRQEKTAAYERLPVAGMQKPVIAPLQGPGVIL